MSTKESSDRMPVSSIIDNLILLSQTRYAGIDSSFSLTLSDSRGGPRPSPGPGRGLGLGGLECHEDYNYNASESAVTDTVRYLSTALGQISMRRDCLEASEKTSTDLAELSRCHSVVSGQLEEVWATALRVQAVQWVNLAAAATSYEQERDRDSDSEFITLGRREENVMCGTVMGRLVTECLQSVSAGLLRNDICPTSDEENCEDGRRVDLNSVINSLEVISNSPHAKRIAFLIRGCFPG